MKKTFFRIIIFIIFFFIPHSAWGDTSPTPIITFPCSKNSCPTSFGFNFPTTPEGFVGGVFSLVLSIAGVIALLLIVFSGYRLAISRGNQEAVKEGQEQLTAAIIGLLFIIFSVVILRIIGVDILQLPGIGK